MKLQLAHKRNTQQLKFEQFAEHCYEHYWGVSENLHMLGTDAYSRAEHKTIWTLVQDSNHVELLNVKSTADCWDIVSDTWNRSALF